MTRQRICGAVCLLGFLFLLGTAGASDCNLIPLRQIIAQILVGMALFAGGAYGGGFIR